MGRMQICAYELGASGKPQESAGAGGRVPSQPSRKAAIVKERDQFGILSFFLSSIGCCPVQMASARVLPPSDHSQVEVEFHRAPYQEDHHGTGFCLLFVCPFLVCGDAAQEVCG